MMVIFSDWLRSLACGRDRMRICRKNKHAARMNDKDHISFDLPVQSPQSTAF